MATKTSDQVSKTARASQPKTVKASALNISADVRRIIPLGGGRHAYLLHPATGKTLRFATGSDAFVAELVEIVANGGPDMTKELRELAFEHPADGWSDVLGRLEAALAAQY